MVSARSISRRLVIVIPLMLFCALIYTFMHEGGHALFAMLFGGKLTSFNINFFNFSAHTGSSGQYGTTQRAIISAAGISLPVLIWAGLMVFLPRRSNLLNEWLKILLSLGVINTLLAWIIIPILFLSGNAPGDDSTTFLRLSGFPPLVVSLVALLIYLACWALFVARTGGFRSILKFAKEDRGIDRKSPSQRRTLGIMLGVSMVVLVMAIGLNASIDASNPLDIPTGYTALNETYLAGRDYMAEPLYNFHLDSSREVRLFFAMENINQGPLKIELRGPGGYNKIYFQMSDGNRIGRATVHPDGELLDSGDYQILITVPRNPSGKISVFAYNLP